MEEVLAKVFGQLFVKAKGCLVPKESNISEVAKVAIRAHSCFLKNIEAAIDHFGVRWILPEKKLGLF